MPWGVRMGAGRRLWRPLADPSETCSYRTPSSFPKGKMASSLPLFSEEVWQQHRQPAFQAPPPGTSPARVPRCPRVPAGASAQGWP